MNKDDRIRLQHMADAARECLDFARHKQRKDLDENRQLTLALIKEIEIIGEAAYQVSEETRRSLPLLPWEDMVGMRHRLVHAYFDINLDILWQTVQEDIPSLLRILENILKER